MMFTGKMLSTYCSVELQQHVSISVRPDFSEDAHASCDAVSGTRVNNREKIDTGSTRKFPKQSFMPCLLCLALSHVQQYAYCGSQSPTDPSMDHAQLRQNPHQCYHHSTVTWHLCFHCPCSFAGADPCLLQPNFSSQV